MWAVDARPGLWNLGYQLFNDGPASTKPLSARFIHADVIGQAWAGQYYARYGGVDIILANQFFDTLSDVYCITIRRWLRPLLKPGTVIVGYQIGAEFPLEQYRAWYDHRLSLQQNWKALERYSEGPPMSLELDSYKTVDLQEWGLERREWEWIGPNMYGVYFTVRRSA